MSQEDLRLGFVSEFGAHLESLPDEASNQRHWLIGYGAEFFRKRVDAMYHTLGKSATEVEATIRLAYKTYAQPINIPYVPDLLIEPAVDAALEDALVAIVLSGHDWAHPKAEAPAAPPAGSAE